MFKIGDTVVRIKESNHEVIKGKKYVINSISENNKWIYLKGISQYHSYHVDNFELYRGSEMQKNENKPRVHAELIKAWADGAVIQRKTNDEWSDCQNPGWAENVEYRIKPKPDGIHYALVVAGNPCVSLVAERHQGNYHNLKLIFDGETGKLKDAKVI